MQGERHGEAQNLPVLLRHMTHVSIV